MPYPWGAMTTHDAPRHSPGARPVSSILVGATVLALLLLACGDGTAGAKAAPGARPQFQLKTLDGRRLGPKDFPGQVVVVDFWATWCGPCHVQAQILEPLYRDFKGRGVQFLAANVGEEEATVKSFLKNRPIPYTVLLDSDSTVSNDLGVYALPTLIIVDKQGKISFLQSGLTDGDTLRRIIHQSGA
jgi:cytochrome c biogenesis protein CcmG, thiol:disulfide interchange protein DsbE